MYIAQFLILQFLRKTLTYRNRCVYIKYVIYDIKNIPSIFANPDSLTAWDFSYEPPLPIC